MAKQYKSGDTAGRFEVVDVLGQGSHNGQTARYRAGGLPEPMALPIPDALVSARSGCSPTLARRLRVLRS